MMSHAAGRIARRGLLGGLLVALSAAGAEAHETATQRRRAPAGGTARPFVGTTTGGTDIRRRAPAPPQATQRPTPTRRDFIGTPTDGQGI